MAITRDRRGRYARRSGVHPLHVAMLLIAGVTASASYTYSVRPDRERVVYRDRDVPYTIEYQTVVREAYPVPVCQPLPTRSGSYRNAVNTLAAAIPASALR